ncbi:protein serine/threonine phosphatase 2C [Schizopora paradoxa]|uniref:Protein serine/threonine phosphatase 2C n=1 Tax=Schizopora paradoxa TaxID=27342 RepID=A0A0H2SS68_9AGAM|nr:protein serine/threonine phosphatase 2C [Schizopora paradoxa]
MLRRSWRPFAATVVVFGASGYTYRTYVASRKHIPETFELKVKQTGADGKRTLATKVFPMLTMAEVDERLNRHATSQAVYRPGGITWKHTTAQVASNDPIEDTYAAAIVERDVLSDTPDGDFVFYSVLDGHSGPHTSRLLSRILIPAVALQLRSLREEPNTFVPKSSFMDNLKSFITHSPAKSVPFDADPKYVSLAIQTAFALVDSEIINTPLRIIAEHIKQSKSKDPLPDLSKHPLALASMLPALSGSCALLACIDTANRDLYVACTGDCRAVAGIWEEDESGNGTWRVDVLSEDQTLLNPKELERLHSEHPEDEKDSVVQRGRILGGLQPSRAFGDARYKWPADLQQVLSRAFMEGNNQPMRKSPANLKTPPYVTAQPVITHRKLPFLPPQLPGDIVSKSSAVRFIVLATDGLWDELTSGEVVQLVAGHIANVRGSVSQSELDRKVPTRLSDDPDSQTVEGKDRRRKREGSPWAFVDENVSTHLIRNAFGGADNFKLRKLLSIPAPLSRSYRDDVTVTVLWWEDGKQSQQRQETFVVDKAKL